jgi:ribosomal protein S12 methylthiotransferase
MQQQQEIAFSLSRAMVNKVVPVIVETKTGKKTFEGRTAGDAPDIDTMISLHGNGVQVGQIARARVTGINVYDLIGDLV